MKTCSKCKEEKELSGFYKDKRATDGYRSQCIACAKIHNKQYYSENREEILVKSLQYERDNPEMKRKHTRLRYLRHKEKCDIANKAWYEANKGRKNELTARRREGIKQATPPWADDEWNEFIVRECYALARLRTDIVGVSFHVDHIVPIGGKNVCGLHIWNNLQVITAKENTEKNNKWQS